MEVDIQMEEVFKGIEQLLPILGENKDIIIEKTFTHYILQPSKQSNTNRFDIRTPCTTSGTCFIMQLHPNEIIGLPRNGIATVTIKEDTLIFTQGTQKTTLQKRNLENSNDTKFQPEVELKIKASNLHAGVIEAKAATNMADAREALKQLCIAQVGDKWYTMGCDGVRFNAHLLVNNMPESKDIEVTIHTDSINELIQILAIHGEEEVLLTSNQTAWKVQGTNGCIIGEHRTAFVNWRLITPNKSLFLQPTDVTIRLSQSEQLGIERALYLHLMFGPKRKEGNQIVKLEFSDQLHIEIIDQVTKSSTKYLGIGESLNPVDSKTWDEWFPTMPLVKYTGLYLLDYLYDAIKAARNQIVDLHVSSTTNPLVLSPLYLIVDNQIRHILQSRRE